MNRKRFLQTTSIGLGLTMIPGFIQGNTKIESSLAADPKIISDNEGDVFDVLGDVQRHKLTGKETKNQIVEWVDDVAPGVGIPPHIHTREDEIFRVVKGEIEMMVDGKITVLKAGDIAYAPKNVPHAWKVVGTEKAQMITSAFPAGIEEMFYELADLPAGPPDFQKVSEICGNYGIRFLKG